MISSRLGKGDADAALAALQERGHRSEFVDRVEAYFCLHVAAGARAHLEEAKRLLDYLVEHACDEHRDSILENVSLHREIQGAWAKQG